MIYLLDSNNIIRYTANYISVNGELNVGILDGVQEVANYDTYTRVDNPIELNEDIVNKYKYVNGEYIRNLAYEAQSVYIWDKTAFRGRFLRTELVCIDFPDKYIPTLMAGHDPVEIDYYLDLFKSIMIDFDNTPVFYNTDTKIREALMIFASIGILTVARVDEILSGV